MATAEIVGDELRVRFARWERFAVRREEITVPLARIRTAEQIGNPLARTRGGRIGMLVSGVFKVGVWGLGTGTRQLVSVRRSGPALRIVLDDAEFAELLLSLPDAAELADALKARA
ncbi:MULTISPECIES: hypothetical protein [Amycolatopsis]|uniref:Bacterial Pleckstrin homology domain-containing protein n=1 Tax=Amycolatopsis dendrobii TaxID=2760662 RepID=A0A7W3ZBM0_9PSEU|nr:MULTISPECIES: hypothetical protein [Amycolatopsis]MBB1154964.1 hypothetical protein [Amycolatopsis dendrobii]UKD56226.1 hypothetical protein L3Q65_05780 [Amycolatopsis sp. FU40]